MKTILKWLAIAAATATTLLTATSAEAFSLRTEREDLFNIFNGLVNQERLQKEGIAMQELQADTLRWDGGADFVDVFFINEGAGYRNQLFYSANDGELEVIFDDIASPESILANSDGPLLLGDGKHLGGFSGNTLLDFVIKANGKWNSNGHLYGGDASKNADGLQHVIAYEYWDAVDQENWVILGFEDLFGKHYSEGGWSDRDFNDVVVAVRGVTGKSVDVPEPATALALLGMTTLGITRVRRSH